jgi:hypothetical protein
MKNRCAGLVVLPIPESEPGTYHKDTKAQRGCGHESALSALCSFDSAQDKPWCIGGSIAGLVMISLFAFGVANADIEFVGVLYPRLYVLEVDSVNLQTPDMTFFTPGWGSEAPYDTFHFTGVTAWPETLVLHGIAGPFPLVRTIVRPKPDSWYPLNFSGAPPMVKFYGTGYGTEESEPVVERPQLAVNPSLVTGQMTVRLSPVGSSRPVVEIHDAVGNVVRSLDCTAGTDGAAAVTWNREDDRGRLVPKGVYFCRYSAADVIAVRKVLVAH